LTHVSIFTQGQFGYFSWKWTFFLFKEERNSRNETIGPYKIKS